MSKFRSTDGATNLPQFVVERYGRLGVEVSNFTDQLAASVVGGNNVGTMARKGVVKERLL